MSQPEGMSENKAKNKKVRPFSSFTIHSKDARFEHGNGNNRLPALGKIVKGATPLLSIKNEKASYLHEFADNIEFTKTFSKPRPYSSASQKIPRRKILSSKPKLEGNQTLNERGVLYTDAQKSSIFDRVFFAKCSLREMMNKVQFEQELVTLPPEDDRIALIYKIICNIFVEIEIFVFSLLISQNPRNLNYFTYFTENNKIPLSSCCEMPVIVEFQNTAEGRLFCSNPECFYRTLNEFFINFDDSRKLWKENEIYKDSTKKKSFLSNTISKLIVNGRFKHLNLSKEADSKLAAINFLKKPGLAIGGDENVYDPSPFLTDVHTEKKQRMIPEEKEQFEEIPKEGRDNIKEPKTDLKDMPERLTLSNLAQAKKQYDDAFIDGEKFNEKFSKNRIFDKSEIMKPNLKFKPDSLTAVQKYKHYVAEREYLKQMVNTAEGKLKFKKSYLDHDKSLVQDESLIEIKNMIGGVLQQTN